MGELDFGGGINGWRQAITKLSEGIDNSYVGEISFIIDELKKQIDDIRDNKIHNSLYENALIVSRLGDFYLSQVRYNPEEIVFMDKVYKIVDKLISRKDEKKLEEAKVFLTKQLKVILIDVNKRLKKQAVEKNGIHN
jgi:hypothetical protein